MGDYISMMGGRNFQGALILIYCRSRKAEKFPNGSFEKYGPEQQSPPCEACFYDTDHFA